jgi:hypothetical protein
VFEETHIVTKIPSGVAYVQTGRSKNPKYCRVPIVQMYFVKELEKEEPVKLSPEHSEYRWIQHNQFFEKITKNSALGDAYTKLTQAGLLNRIDIS